MTKKKTSSRTKNSARNMIVSILFNSITIIFGIATQRIFLRLLNTEYLGLNSLFSNILTMLSVAELGVTNAVIFSMYEPLAKDDKKTICALMAFYRRWYWIIGGVVLGLGLCILPFIPNIVGEQSLDVNLYLIFTVSLADIVLSYFLGYKRSILVASQQNYIIDICQIIYVVLVSTLQMLALFITRNYYIYILVRLALRILQNIVLIIIANKKFPYIREKNPPKLKKEIRKSIFTKVKGLFYHKIGGFIVLGTDNLVITTFLGLAVNGLYASYYMIISALQSIIMQCITATTASVGNLLVENDSEKQFLVFRRIRFINFWLAVLGSTGLLIVMDSFITVWLGGEYVLGLDVLMALVLNFYFYVSRSSFGVFKDAAGIYHEDRFVPIVESVLNISASIILVKLIGLPGVFIGTFISGLALYCFSYPKFVYKKLFKRSYRCYTIETLGLALIATIIITASFLTTRFLAGLSNLDGIGLLIFNIVMVFVIPNALIVLIFVKNQNFQYCTDLLKKVLKKVSHAKRKRIA